MILLASWLACRPEPAVHSHTHPPADSGIPAPHTGSPGPSTPTRIEASCAPTDNPLRFSCSVEVEPDQPVQIRLAPTSGIGSERVQIADGSGPLGLYLLAPETPYGFSVTAVDWPLGLQADGTLTTGVIPDHVASRLAVSGASSASHVGAHSPCTKDAIAVIWDTVTGELVWYEDMDDGSFGLLNMVRFTPDRTVLGQTGRSVVEVDRQGHVLLQLQLGVNYDAVLHHDLFERDGLVYLLFKEPGDRGLDGFLVFDRLGHEIARWLASEHLDVPEGTTDGFMHTNTLWVDPSGDVLLSSYQQNTVLRVNGDPSGPDFGEVVWALAGTPPGTLGDDFVIDWSAVDGADAFGHQHDVHLRTDGRLAFLDNSGARALVLGLDPLAGTATVDEAWPAIDLVCLAQGTAAETSSGAVMVACSGPRVREVDPVLGTEAWRAEVSCLGPASDLPPDDLPNPIARWYPLSGW